MVKQRRTGTWGLWAALLAVGAAVVVEATTVRITPVVTGEKVYATFSAPAAFTPNVRNAVHSGLPVTVTFVAELRRTSVFWFDRTLADTVVASTVKFDTLTGAYQVSKWRDGTVHWSQQTQKEDEMRRWVTEFERVPLDEISALDGSGEYYIRVCARDSLPRGFSLWPWGRAGMSGRVELTAGR